MSDGFAVQAAALQTHASHVDAVAAGVEQARDAASQVSLDAGAYGHLCSVLPALVGALQGRGTSALAAASGELRDAAGRLRTTAHVYAEADEAVRRHLSRFAP